MTHPAYRRVTSLTRSILAKTPRIMVFCPKDPEGLTLSKQLQRIGCTVELCWPPAQEIDNQVDLIFLFLAPEAEETCYRWLEKDHPPIISITNFENPAVIDEALRLGVMGMMVSPIRAVGVLSAVIMALQHAKQYEKNAERVQRLENKINNVRTIEEAKKVLTNLHGISESDAYEMLRSHAMNLRSQIEDVAHQIIQASKVLSQALPSPIKN